MHRIDPRQALDSFAVVHLGQMHLAERLEAIADCLPHPPGDLCRSTIAELRSGLPRLYALEDDFLFKLLARHLERNSPIRTSLKRLRDEHVEDRDAACDVADSLELVSGVDRTRASEGLGFQLRALFVAIRRHEAFEREIVIPAAEARFTYDDRDALAAAMTNFRGGHVGGFPKS